MELTQKQLEELVAVFQAEAIEHIKSMADIFLAMERVDQENISDLLAHAFREAHSLKGASATLGFGRIEVVTHRIEDVLGLLISGERKITSGIVDLLLQTLDVVEKAVGQAIPGDDTFTIEENEQIKLLGELLEDGKEAPKTEKKRVAIRRKTTSLLPPEQLEQLNGVFRAESIEHIKALAEVFFALEDGSEKMPELLTRAFREAHSLKGSAATLGFDRVEAITHKLEDVLGQLSRESVKVTTEIIDLLLSALDTIRLAVDASTPGEEDLTNKESQIIASLNSLTAKLAGEETPGETKETETEKHSRIETWSPSEPPSQSPSRSPSRSPSQPAQPKREQKPTNEQTAASPLPQRTRDEFIRIQESKIEAVIVQVAELFEANLQIESLAPELNRFCTVSTEITEMLGGLLREFERTEYEVDLYPIIERAQNLTNQLKTTSTRFDRDERQLSKLIQNSQEGLRNIRLAPVSTIFVMLRRQVREIGKVTGKRIELFLGGGEYMVDRKVLEAIEEPLVHIMRNAADHGIEDASARRKTGKNEVGRLSVTARHTGDAVEITVADDGKGIDPESIRSSLVEKRVVPKKQAKKLSRDQLFDHLFESGFSTQRDVSKMSGRGVGLDVVKYTIERLGGEVRLDSQLGEGTAITLRLPLAMSTIRCLLVRTAGKVFALPASNVEKVIVPRARDISLVGGGRVIVYKGQNVPFVSLDDLLGLTSRLSTIEDGSRIAIMVSFGERLLAFSIDELIEYTQLILKPLGDLLGRVSNLSGISLLGSGEVALVLNPSDLIRAAGGVRKETSKPIFPTLIDSLETARILVVDDSIATRTLEKTLLESAGFSVMMASDGYKALDTLAANRCDLVITDVQMPNMDGFELTRTIKSRSQFSHLPVILITSLGSDDDKARGLAAGADAYIVKKELTQSELVDTISQLL
ncbi:MAG: response regulator [Proteobacteria bacterium]|nr:response regulator [Pseudomonadota bacterium]